MNYDFVGWNPGDDSFCCPTTTNCLSPTVRHFRLQQHEEFKRDGAANAARRETDREQEGRSLPY